MHHFARAAVLAALLIPAAAFLHGAYAFDNGQYDDVPDHIRQWFKSVRSPNGVPCCDIADGHRTDYDIRADGYYVPVPWLPAGENWIKVPPQAVIHDAGNPVGEAVVWYVEESQYIRCFVPGGGV